ncbi:tyrosine-protein phosphatase [Lacrimispora sp.]|uniref:tyrosine-protein phosphatase n=1 Tax=Lacrimispora sp. TaxID=2719234 RepID=UPI0028A60175|nr:tyrosine-protein phosphatase [Lacrimispora sp.]
MKEAGNMAIGRIRLEKLPNTRDLGGIKTADGRSILPRRLIRSGTLFEATKGDLQILAGECGLGTVIDFRTETERKQKPDPEIPGILNIFNPILDEKTVGITFEEEKKHEKRELFAGLIDHASSLGGKPELYISKLYEDLVLSDFAAKQYGRFFDLLLEADDRAVLWHCSAGKDRVGIGTALLLSALSVDRETIVKDFVQTNTYVMDRAENVAKGVRDKTGDHMLADCVRVLLMVSEDYINQAFHAIESCYDTVDTYLTKRIGLSLEKKNLLRQKFLTSSFVE